MQPQIVQKPLEKDAKVEVGYVISNRNFIIHLDGLPHAKINDIVVSEDGVRGWINAIYDNQVEVLLMDEAPILPGQIFKSTNQRLAIPVGDFLLGRAINPLGVPIDGHRLSVTPDAQMLELDQQASGIATRQFITEQFETGISLIDTLIPLGKGQRELVMGDAHAGKTTFLINLIVNQKASERVCVYAMIGKPLSQVKMLIDVLATNKALQNTVIIGASSSDPTPLIYLAPQSAFTIAEYFQRLGKDVLLILDDLGYHAKIYREIALLGNKSPGRESYPGDIFYQHAHLIERAGKFKPEYGGGSITCLPVIELNANEFTGFIPTNLMSMTDGHLLFKSSLHNQGQNPAIDISLSVSRVGRQTQNRVQNILSQKIRQLLAQAEGIETLSRFSSELPPETRLLINQKKLIDELITQDSLLQIPLAIQTILFGLVFTSFLKERDVAFIRRNKKLLIDNFSSNPDFQPTTKAILQVTTEEQLQQLLEAVGQKLVGVCK